MIRKLLVSMAFVLAAFFWLRDPVRLAEDLEAVDFGHDNGNAARQVSSKEKVASSEPAPRADSESEEAGDSLAPPSFLPKARVVARVVDPIDTQGRQRVIETLETSMRQRFVRVERVVRPEAGGDVEREVAMVANQLMLQRPERMSESVFLELLDRAGALTVKPLGEGAFLATFYEQPENPRALDLNLAKVQELAGAEISAEPNYIRRIF